MSQTCPLHDNVNYFFLLSDGAIYLVKKTHIERHEHVHARAREHTHTCTHTQTYVLAYMHASTDMLAHTNI